MKNVTLVFALGLTAIALTQKDMGPLSFRYLSDLEIKSESDVLVSDIELKSESDVLVSDLELKKERKDLIA